MYHLVHSMYVPHGTLNMQDAAKEKAEPQSGTTPGELSGGFYPRGDTRPQSGYLGQSGRNQQADAGPLLRGTRCHRGNGHVPSRRPTAGAISSERIPRGRVASVCAFRFVGTDDQRRVPGCRLAGHGPDEAELEWVKTGAEILRRAATVVVRYAAGIPA